MTRDTQKGKSFQGKRQNGERGDEDDEELDPDQKRLARIKREVRKEIIQLPDPKKFAEQVQRHIDAGRFEKALELTRLGSAVPDRCIYSWNHILRFLMANIKPRMKLAMKLFNEVCPSHPPQ